MEPISLQMLDGGPRRLLALGAHADDIEIGCGGTLLRMLSERPELEVTWVVLCSTQERAREARGGAAAFLEAAHRSTVLVKEFRESFLPADWAQVKDVFEEIKRSVSPELILTHYREDRHQDHRVVSDLTWNTWRNHMILEYEIPKFDGDLGAPNFFAHLPAAVVERKIDLLLQHYPSQSSRQWFSPDVFRGLARIRGMECAAPEGLAEGFHCRKAVF
jgi:LmbE family N-acetylglucosaminyl deacetylase